LISEASAEDLSSQVVPDIITDETPSASLVLNFHSASTWHRRVEWTDAMPTCVAHAYHHNQRRNNNMPHINATACQKHCQVLELRCVPSYQKVHLFGFMK